MLASHAFRPRTSIRSRKAAVDSAFVSPSYRGRVGVDHGVFHVAAACVFAGPLPPSSKSKFKVEILQPDPSDLIGRLIVAKLDY